MPSIDVEKLTPQELTEAWPALSEEERMQGFAMLPPDEAREFLSHLSSYDAVQLLSSLPPDAQRQWLRLLPPDDIVDLVQELEDPTAQQRILGLLDEPVQKEAVELLEYEHDEAGGVMTPRYARLRPNMTVNEAIEYLRRQKSEKAEMIYYAYAVDDDERLLGVVSFRDLVISRPDRRIREIMTTDVIAIPDDMDQEEVGRIFAHEDLLCLPVVDHEGRMRGIVTADDIVDVVDEEATEDMHKMGGIEALDAPYLQVGLLEMLRKRGVWLVALMILGFFTVEAMEQYKHTLRTQLAVLLSFIPLIISCGGNTGSQAATLVVRAMALDHVRLRDWWLVARREIVVGIGLGVLLGAAGALAAVSWNALAQLLGSASRLGDAPLHIALAVSSGIVCVVLWGTVAGSMLPFILRRLGADPASSSAPLVATIMDATGLLLYFTIGGAVLQALS